MITSNSTSFTQTQYQSLLETLEKLQSDYPDNMFFRRLFSAVEQHKVSSIEFLYLLKDFFLSIQHQVELKYTTFNFVRKLNQSELELARLIGVSQREVGNQLYLIESAVHEADLDIYQFKNTRNTVKKDMDICLQQKLKAHGYKTYKTEGQQLAVRTCLTAKKGSTLFINLPTGCGKSLIIQSSVLFQRKFSSTIVLMPTVGLAIEQAQRMSEILQGSLKENLSWHANLSENERRKIRSDLLAGNQQVLFTSPEALTTSLLNTLFILAKRGQLSEIVIDEAHLIDSWGANFRPEFQKFGALVSTLRTVSATPFNLIFLSATFTQNSIEKINKIYGEPNVLPTVVNGNFLRPEIKTSFEKLPYKEHFTKLLDKAFKLPKPLIIYTTKKDDSNKIYKAFKQLGLTRVGLFTGETSYNQRIDVIDKWQRDEYDIMVATSAFGVGMDKDDIKSVIHASVPENIDRFYQEIGRAGRNGSAATAYLIYHEAQLSTAQGVNSDKIISIEKGLSRWKDMWRDNKEPQNSYFKEQGFYELNVGLFGNNLRKKTETNADWNWGTLLFLQRNGLIRIYYDIPDTTTINDDGTITQADSEFWKRYQEKVIVELIDSNVLHDSFWENELNSARDEELKIQRKRFEELRQVITSPEIPLCERLTTYYSLFGSRPEKACRGCLGCEGFLPTLGTSPTLQNFEPENSVIKELDNLLSIDNVLPIYFEKSESYNDFLEWSKLVKSLLEKKLVNRIVGDEKCLAEIQEHLPPGFSHFWISDSNSNDQSLWPSILLYTDHSTIDLPKLQEQMTLVIANKSAKNSSSSFRNWYQIEQCSISLHNFKLLVGI
ncbi:protein DpdF [Alteromonas sp. RKMC-009]|uniref:protein DpdF n=1 Tax=Alteromonas sp. RKMC-009 TaxID=2267264 RepID=UPI000E67CB72|nr:protein DpdF [Alteromonas sp. RKMC-009]AYA62601.3 ATP-dependent DNA helicase RecQ [Alteromonas sp. RKMC-009]